MFGGVDGWGLPEWAGVVGGLTGIASVVVTAVIGVRTVRVAREALAETRRTADETRRTADAGEAAVSAAKVSAAAAEAAAREAGDVARMEREREHDRLGPGPVPTIVTTLESNPRSHELPRNLFGTVTVPRDYRVLADAVYRGGTRVSLSLDRVLHAGRTYRFPIELWPPGRTEPEVDHIAFRFWVPTDTDPVEAWKCPCDRPMVDGAERGHWEWRAPISYDRPNPRSKIF
jgi:hypothetical protein